jgi:hypothetical protein
VSLRVVTHSALNLCRNIIYPVLIRTDGYALNSIKTKFVLGNAFVFIYHVGVLLLYDSPTSQAHQHGITLEYLSGSPTAGGTAGRIRRGCDGFVGTV